jgi:DNA-directed RNA polymerase specialized sigma24 family protein
MSCPCVLEEVAVREESTQSQLAFNRLLEWLDEGVDSHGERYLEIRRRLVSYFERRGRSAANELTDEAFNRIGRTLEQRGEIAIVPPARYCYVVARFVLLEDIRRERRHVPLDEPRLTATQSDRMRIAESDDTADANELRLESLDRCLQKLKPEQRDLIVEYYRDTGREKVERRRDLAKRLGISMNALGIRAFRIRDALMECVKVGSADRVMSGVS